MTTNELIEAFHAYFGNQEYDKAITLLENQLNQTYPNVCLDEKFVVFSLINMYRITDQVDAEKKLLHKYYNSDERDDSINEYMRVRLDDLTE